MVGVILVFIEDNPDTIRTSQYLLNLLTSAIYPNW